METEARYTLIGLFTLVVTVLAFAFVYWLNTVGGLTQRSTYRVRYETTVSGLTRGSAVLFNGIRVGEVTELALSPERPRFVTVSISVDRATPIRSDTRAAIDFQGLMGAPAVSLFGGAENAGALDVTGQQPPLLIADPQSGVTMSQAARDALRHVDTLVTENADHIKSIVANIDTFSTALGRNSNRIDGIVAGLEKFTGGGAKPQPRIFDLPPPKAFAKAIKVPQGQLIVADPSALATFDTDKVLVRSTDGEPPSLGNAQWPDVLPRLIQSRIIQAFEAAGYTRTLSRAPDTAAPEATLMMDLRGFQIEMGAAPVAIAEIAAKLVSGDGKIIAAKTFKAQSQVAMPASGLDAASAVAALRQAFADASQNLVVWACASLP